MSSVLSSLSTIDEVQHLNLELEADPYLFYQLGDGHALFTSRVKQGTVLTVGPLIPVSSMFQMYWLTHNNIKVGFYFVSQFHVENAGGYIVTYMNHGRGKAFNVEVLLKIPELVVYHYKNRGTLVVCPVIGDDVKTIFEEQ